ncbi:MAG: selenium-binding protein SBP56-related protein [Candidatus Eiseniibacteriota bacterium]|jgi:predicted ester cyclase
MMRRGHGIVVVLVASAALACGDAGRQPVASGATREDTSRGVEEVRDFARRYTAAWNSGEPGNVAAFFAEDGSLTVNDSQPAVGSAAITEVARGFMTGFPDMVLLFDGLEPAGDRVSFHWTFVGTNTGPGGSGQRVRFSGYESWRFDRDGLIADSLGHFDAAEYERQLENGVDSYLYVWAGDPDEDDADFLAVIDASPDSARFGEVLSTVTVGASAGAHHSEHVMPSGGRLVVNGFTAGRSWVIDVRDPLHPSVAASFEGAGPYTSPHSFDRTPDGNVLATFQYYGGDTDTAGGLVELDPEGRFIRGSDAADAADPELHPCSLAIAPELDRVLTTTSDMSMRHEGRSVQIWSLSGLELLHTVLLPPGPQGDEHLNPAEPRFLPDGSAIVNTFNCGLYLLTDIAGDAPQAEFIGSLPRDPGSTEECSLPVLFNDYWVQTSDPLHAMGVFDINDPRHPVQVDELRFAGDATPHWLSRERGTNRIVMTGGGADLQGMVVLVEIDPTSGKLAIVEGFGAAGAIGVDMRRQDWPHGSSGPAIPHGAVFSR